MKGCARLISEILAYRHLVGMLAWRDIRVRYKQSVMGVLWALLMPILIVCAGLLVRQAFSIATGKGIGTGEVIALSVKSVHWAFVVSAIRNATTSLTSNRMLITKIYFSREVLPLASVLASLVDFTIALPVVLLLVALSGIGLSWHILWVPVLLGLLVLQVVGFALFLSCANLFLRDVRYIVEVALMFGIFFTPVLYNADMLGDWQRLIMLNPVAPILEGLRFAVVEHGTPDLLWLAYAAAWSAFGTLAALLVFDRAEFAFAERI